ncbi:MAG: hypothetical protein ACE145_12205 [Terriglobia bacterium]
MKKFGVIDLLFVISLLMIAIGLFGPIYQKSRAAKVKATPVAAAPAPAAARPVR